MSSRSGYLDLLGVALPDRREPRDRFIYEPLLSTASEEAGLFRQADILGMDLGRRYQPGNAVYALDEIGLGAWVGLSDTQTRLDLASRLVGPLATSADLLETLEVFFAENGSPSAAAARLCVHRNTLSYRLDRVARLTGLDPRRFDDAVQLRLALLLRHSPEGTHSDCANAQEEAARGAPRLGR